MEISMITIGEMVHHDEIDQMIAEKLDEKGLEKRASRRLQITQNNQVQSAAVDPLGEAEDDTQVSLEEVFDEYVGIVRAMHDILPEGPRFEYLRRSLVESQCYSLSSAIRRTETTLSDRLTTLRKMVVSQRGDEEQNDRMERLMEFIGTLETQLEVYRILLSAAEKAHSQIIGTDWRPMAQKTNSNPAETATRRQAIEKLKAAGRFA